VLNCMEKNLSPHCCGLKSCLGLRIFSYEEAIQLAYGSSVVLLMCLNLVPEIVHRAPPRAFFSSKAGKSPYDLHSVIVSQHWFLNQTFHQSNVTVLHLRMSKISNYYRQALILKCFMNYMRRKEHFVLMWNGIRGLVLFFKSPHYILSNTYWAFICVEHCFYLCQNVALSHYSTIRVWNFWLYLRIPVIISTCIKSYKWHNSTDHWKCLGQLNVIIW
jgi:hypothetical protein